MQLMPDRIKPNSHGKRTQTLGFSASEFVPVPIQVQSELESQLLLPESLLPESHRSS